jgi:cyclopropane fatty-acyl-phospholipid synthase-like methyltransferase
MLEVIEGLPTEKVSLLDFGCGASHLYEYILRQRFDHIAYSGLDLSPAFINLSQRKFPRIQYYSLDILDDSAALPNFDYIVMNGVFTEKRELTFDEMLAYFKDVVLRVFNKARVAIAFNVMSPHVDWERQDLFHLPLDSLAAFLVKQVSRDFVIRNDYGLYEYTTYVYRKH